MDMDAADFTGIGRLIQGAFRSPGRPGVAFQLKGVGEKECKIVARAERGKELLHLEDGLFAGKSPQQGSGTACCGKSVLRV